MKERISRIGTILYKDIKEYWILIFVFISIPLIAFYLPNIREGRPVKICVVADGKLVKEEFKLQDAQVSYCKSLQEGLDELKREKVDAVVSMKENAVYYNKNNAILVSKIKNALQPMSSNPVRVEVVSKSDKIKSEGFTHVLCAIIVIMIGLIGSPIVFLGEKNSNTLSALRLSPLTYAELAISKALFGFLCTFAALSLFLAVTKSFAGNIGALLVMMFVSSLLISILSVLLSVPFASIEQMMAVTSPIMFLLIMAEVMNLTNRVRLYLPIQEGFRIALSGAFPWVEIGAIGGGAVVMVFVYTLFMREIRRV